VISDRNCNFIPVAVLSVVQVVWHDSKLELCLNCTWMFVHLFYIYFSCDSVEFMD